MKPFKGIKVVDLTHILAGPFATYQLAQFGADVIKVEKPGAGDIMRKVGGSEELCSQGLGTSFMAQNASKKSIAVDLKKKRGRDVLFRLIDKSDVFVENYRGGALDKLGFSYEDLAAINPRLIYCSLTGFGRKGAWKTYTAYDNVIQAASGLMSVTGTPETRPIVTGAPLIDYGTGYAAAFAIASALFQRENTDRGQYIDISMLDAALTMMSSVVARHLNDDRYTPKDGRISANATYGCYETKSGLLMIGAYSPEQSVRLWNLLGEKLEAQTVSSIALQDLPKRSDHQQALIRKKLSTRTAEEWEVFLQEGHVPAARVRTVDEAIAFSRTIGSPPWCEMRLDDPSLDPVTLPVSSAALVGNKPDTPSAPARHGQHTDEVLRSLGYGENDIRELLAEQSVQ